MIIAVVFLSYGSFHFRSKNTVALKLGSKLWPSVTLMAKPYTCTVEKNRQFNCALPLFQKFSRILKPGPKQCKLKLSPRSQMFIIAIILFIPITQQPEQDRWAENQPTAGF